MSIKNNKNTNVITNNQHCLEMTVFTTKSALQHKTKQTFANAS